MLVELPAGSWGNLMKAFQDQYGSSIPPKELPSQSHFEVLEEMVQDRVFYAESLAQVISLDTENKHRLSNPDSHSSHIAMLFDGSTIRPKRRLVSEMPENLEGFRAKYEIIANVWRMMKLQSPGRAVIVGLTEDTWETHRRWLMDSKRFAMELEVSPGVMRAPGWHLCLSYEQKIREAAMDLVRMQGLPLAEALDRVRNDPEHRMIHWVQLLMQPGHQRPISAPLSSSSSSRSAKRSAPASLQQSALGGQSTHEQTGQAYIHGETSHRQVFLRRQRSGKITLPERPEEKNFPKQGSERQCERWWRFESKNSRFEDLVKKHEDKFVLKREGQEVCFKFQDGKCTDQGCVRAHVCAGCGRNAKWKQCKCLKFD